MDRAEKFELQVAEITAEARDVLLVELRRPSGSALPAFEPGAHLEIDLPNGLIRHYSLTNDSREHDRYVVGVGRAANGRGGSQFIHQRLRCGTPLMASLRNNFRLADSASCYLFVAGGIGITPIMSMVRWCEANARPWRLVYAVRSAQRAAFGETLRTFGDRVYFHFDDEQGAVLDVRPWLAQPGEGEHVYCCGPGPLMGAVKAHSEHWPGSSVHFEYFAAPEGAPAVQSGAFKVVLRRSNRSLSVPSDKSILETLEANDIMVPFSCREGMCGTCETAVCAGEIDHRDYVLTEEQRQAGKSMMLCVSRSLSEELVLDL